MLSYYTDFLQQSQGNLGISLKTVSHHMAKFRRAKKFTPFLVTFSVPSYSDHPNHHHHHHHHHHHYNHHYHHHHTRGDHRACDTSPYHSSTVLLPWYHQEGHSLAQDTGKQRVPTNGLSAQYERWVVWRQGPTEVSGTCQTDDSCFLRCLVYCIGTCNRPPAFETEIYALLFHHRST